MGHGMQGAKWMGCEIINQTHSTRTSGGSTWVSASKGDGIREQGEVVVGGQ